MNDWVEDFIEATSDTTSPELLRKWTAIATIAGVLERKVWVRTRGASVFPNLYVVLVAPPGVGKTVMTAIAREQWNSIDDLHVAHSSLTKAALVDNLYESTRSVMRAGEVPAVVTYNSLLVSANELGTLIPAYENEFMNTLTELYDGLRYSEKRRTKGLTIEIERPFVNILAACTPAYLTSMMPEGAWDQGFASRLILIYSGESIIRSLFEEPAGGEDMQKQLSARLYDIYNLYGRMQFTPEAAQLIDKWQMGGGEPKPKHTKLHYYCSRRTMHALKLSMIASVCESSDLIIAEQHVRRALDWLYEAELYMPEIFKAMSNTSHSEIIEECWNFLFQAYNKAGKKPVPRTRIVKYLSQRTPAHNVDRIIEVMESAGLMRRELTKAGNAYVPVQPED